MYEKRKDQTYYTNRHSCFLLQYHMVLVTKYRRPVLTGGVKEIVYSTIRDIFREKGLVILEMNGEADHVHVLLSTVISQYVQDLCRTKVCPLILQRF